MQRGQNTKKKQRPKQGFQYVQKVFFRRYIHKLGIKTPKFNKYSCPICASSDQVSEKIIDSAKFNCPTKSFLKSKVEEHLNLRDIQRNSFNEQVLNIHQNECVILHDYTRFHEISMRKLHDLNFTV
jgi:hypothetical protein